jgi:chromosome segregation ATPase
MGSLIDELQRRETAARAVAEELRGRIAELTEQLAQAEERLSRLVITRQTVDEVLSEADGDAPSAEPATSPGQRAPQPPAGQATAGTGPPSARWPALPGAG